MSLGKKMQLYLNSNVPASRTLAINATVEVAVTRSICLSHEKMATKSTLAKTTIIKESQTKRTTSNRVKSWSF